ncbi:hypothetical protein E3N88_00642 [Mikania micrantha]|uniref:Uncharacterized protein n=1 Tax=Mikania micrantha TaxID=192012 RepID=A0A5N6Q0D7_9ASTR|nr:hypothetical protein E3N88_00642 [Mikania micrantha]
MDDDLLEAIMRSMQPKEFHKWPPIAQLNWDRNSRECELNRRHRERQESVARSNAYFAQQEINARYMDNEQIRHYEDYYAGITVWQALRGHQSTPQVMTMKVTLWQALRGRRSVPSSPNYEEHPMASTKRPIWYVLP